MAQYHIACAELSYIVRIWEIWDLNKKIRYIVEMGLEGGKGKTETSIKGKKENEKEEN